MPKFLRRGSFYGGAFLPSAKAATLHRAIEPLPLPNELVIPIPAQAEHRVGAVQQHDWIAKSPAGQACTHAPVAGEVLGSQAVSTAFDKSTPALKFRVDGDWDLPTDIDPTSAHTLDQASLNQQWSDAAIIGQGGLGSCTTSKILRAKAQGVQLIIVNGLESEPCLTAHHRIMEEYGHLIHAGLSALRHYLEPQRVFFAIDKVQKHLVHKYQRLLKPTARVVPLQNRYPQGFAPLLIYSILGREQAVDRDPIDDGILVLSVGTLFHLGRASFHRAPMSASVVTVTGDAVKRGGTSGLPMAHPCNTSWTWLVWLKHRNAWLWVAP